MPSRLRRQQMLPPDDDSPVSRREDERRHYDDMNAHDEETGFKGKKTRNHPAHIFNVSLERFCLKSFTTLRGSSLTVVAPRERGRIVVPSFLLLMFVYIIISRMIPQHLSLRHESDWALENTPLKIKLFDFTNANDLGGWHYPASQSFHSTRPINISKSPDYNGLTIVSLRNATIFRRMVASGDYEASERYRRGIVQPDKKEKHTDIYFQHDEEVLSLECRRQNWQGLYFPNCNDFHDIDLGRQAESLHQLEYYDSYRISNGAFRDAWVLQKPSRDNNTESVILKNLRIDLKFTIEDMKGIQRDAIVMERLTSSPRIIDVYGYCATSTIVEAMKYEVEEYVVPGSGMAKQKYLDKFEGLHPMNVYTIEQKLYMALEMAESIADLHGYPEGVVVHDDIQLCQWLEHSDGRIKLGDFNRAEMMEWNDTDNSYCKYENGEVNGNYRAPEEMRNDWLDEKIDVFSFGNNIYGLLTGLWVFYENDDDEVVQNKVIAGQRAYIDDRYRNHSYIEGKLIELMEQCWIEDSEKRVDIFQAVQFLRQVVKEYKKQSKLEQAVGRY